VISRARTALRDFLPMVYKVHSPNISAECLVQYKVVVDLLDKSRGQLTYTDELSDQLICEFLDWMRETGYKGKPYSKVTIRHKRGTLISLWGMAYRKGYTAERPEDVPTIKVPKRNPKAWRPSQVGDLLDACMRTKPLPGGWDGRDWMFTVLAIYDTSYRIGAMLKADVEALDLDTLLLTMEAEDQKDSEELSRPVHPETIEAFKRTLDEPRKKLLRWPYGKREIWIKFGEILDAAGLPSTRRDKFQKLRRTSYTQVSRVAGRQAATTHAGHSSDLSRFYEDREQMDIFDATKMIERPILPTRQLRFELNFE
jgi:integrase